MFLLNGFNYLPSKSKLSTHVTKSLMTSALFSLSFISLSAYATDNNSDYQSTSLISRAEAASPTNFESLSIDDYIINDAIEPCPIETGLISCALEKLVLTNGRNNEVSADYDLAQTFIFPSKAQPQVGVVVISRSGLMDDSISAERYRISFELQDQQSALGWHWIQYGVQHQCARGSTAGQWEWTTALCP